MKIVLPSIIVEIEGKVDDKSGKMYNQIVGEEFTNAINSFKEALKNQPSHFADYHKVYLKN